MSTRTLHTAPALFVDRLPQRTGMRPASGFDIAKDELRRWSGDQRGLVLQVHEGAVWITQESDPGDIILKKGDCFQVSKRGTVLAQGLGSRNRLAWS